VTNRFGVERRNRCKSRRIHRYFGCWCVQSKGPLSDLWCFGRRLVWCNWLSTTKWIILDINNRLATARIWLQYNKYPRGYLITWPNRRLNSICVDVFNSCLIEFRLIGPSVADVIQLILNIVLKYSFNWS